uniref:Uncharacterized protein n=1 Tax=Daphnia galeata TaxID=27404 RepID=A0A8J2WF41_9CRUS|nr:unnamed protein product [Daphnia galeata]
MRKEKDINLWHRKILRSQLKSQYDPLARSPCLLELNSQVECGNLITDQPLSSIRGPGKSWTWSVERGTVDRGKGSVERLTPPPKRRSRRPWK